MMWWGSPFGMGFWPIMMIVMVVFCIGMMAMMMRGGGMQSPWHGSGKSVRDILDERYARGEIDKAEYEDKRRNLAA